MKIKKFFAWVLCILALVLSVFLPYTNVFAKTSLQEAQESGNYDNLVGIRYLIQEADGCIIDALPNSVTMPITAIDQVKTDMRNIYELKFLQLENASTDYPTIAYNHNLLYNGYLEVNETGKYQDGRIWCSQLKADPGAQLMELYGLTNDEDYTDLICGKNGKEGLFNIKMGFSKGPGWGYAYNEENWPDGWPKVGNGGAVAASDCRAAAKHLMYYAKHPASRPDWANRAAYDEGTFTFELEINKGFKFSTFFMDYAGNISQHALTDDALLNAEKYQVFDSVCAPIDVSEADYKESLVENDNIYKIYYKGMMRYVQLDGTYKTRKTYANGALTESDGGNGTAETCPELAEALSEKADAQYAKDDASRKATDIVNCYNTAVENKELLTKVNGYLSSVYNAGHLLVKNAEAFKNHDYKPVYETNPAGGTSDVPVEVLTSFTNDYDVLALEYINGNGKNVEKGIKELIGQKGKEVPALDNYVDLITDFLTYARGMRDKVINGTSLTNEEKAEFDQALDTFKEDVAKFNSDVSKPALRLPIKHTFPDFSKFETTVSKLNTCLSKNNCDTITINNMEAGFYSFSGEEGSQVLTCTVGNTVQSALDELGELLGTTVEYSGFTPSEGVDYDDYNETNGDGDPCYNAGIEGMSWILCPALNNMVVASDGISKALDWLLEMKSELYGSDSATHKAWSYFRDIANIIVIILLLVVIVSQLTGYGIDNYGIKKALPRLISMAVLINLSFIICQIAIDLSNILGSGLNDLFKSIGLNINSSIGAEGVMGGIVSALFVSAGVAGALGGTAITVASMSGAGMSTMLVVMLVLIFAVVLVAVIAFFLLLAGRFVVLLVFTAVAPVAFACYILPNTQEIFKKWWKIFEAALVIYPICGGLYGASFIIRAIVFEKGNGYHPMMAMAGIIVPYLPFLLIPTLAKGVLAGFGALGGALSGIKNGIKGGLSKSQDVLRQTEAYKNDQIRAQRGRNAKAAGLKLDQSTGNYTKRDDPKTRVGKWWQNRRVASGAVARAQARVLADQEAMANEANMGKGDFASKLEARQATQEKAAENAAIVDQMKLIEKETNNGANEARVRDIFNEAMSSGNISRARAAVRIAGRRADTAASFMKGTLMSNNYSEDAMKGVAKEFSEGETSKVYRGASPVAFEYAAEVNKGGFSGGFSDFATNKDNLHKAIDRHVTTVDEFSSVKNSGLEEFANMVSAHELEDYDAQGLQKLARDTIKFNNENGQGLDRTKAFSTYRLAYGDSEFMSKMQEDGVPIDPEALKKFEQFKNNNTFTARGAGGEVTFGRGRDGEWRDSGGNVMEGDFGQVRQSIIDQRQQPKR
ncbi:hypothetical protein IJH24_01245 [Candidatus Saccharibacteria bacterium]|nr:hypothetical protein [Candidatus Saccharibacteria bacterium]